MNVSMFATAYSAVFWTSFLTVSPLLVVGKNIPSFAGPYMVVLISAYDCPDNLDYFDSVNMRFSHFNPAAPYQKQRAYGNSTFKTDYDDRRWGSVIADIRSNNQWKLNAFHFNKTKNNCSDCRKDSPQWFRAMYNQDPNAPGPCLVKKGLYIMNGTAVDHFNAPRIPVLPYGHYRLRAINGIQNRMLGCMMSEIKVIPKLV
ncbi:uncharacterized protein LOC113202244 [Frankliniella occidentalis]|uniref:Uncharacterized protein LOC113202244 n=1 Tax=Frankliniella occidentalis TaxID=133901 RepID=A0A9C6X4J8_FRAOC|nr:uncharacterized protein LOC113202244 [Frankliniella occidentalis]